MSAFKKPSALGSLFLILLGAGLCIAVQLGFIAWRYAHSVHPQLPAASQALTTITQSDPINPAWLKSGNPQFFTTTYFTANEKHVATGVWEAVGPATFEWHYTTDETVMVLEGSAQITYNGKTETLSPGKTVYFRTGTMVLWNVPVRIKKAFILHDPGSVARRVRPFLSAP